MDINISALLNIHQGKRHRISREQSLLALASDGVKREQGGLGGFTPTSELCKETEEEPLPLRLAAPVWRLYLGHSNDPALYLKLFARQTQFDAQ